MVRKPFCEDPKACSCSCVHCTCCPAGYVATYHACPERRKGRSMRSRQTFLFLIGCLASLPCEEGTMMRCLEHAIFSSSSSAMRPARRAA